MGQAGRSGRDQTVRLRQRSSYLVCARQGRELKRTGKHYPQVHYSSYTLPVDLGFAFWNTSEWAGLVSMSAFHRSDTSTDCLPVLLSSGLRIPPCCFTFSSHAMVSKAFPLVFPVGCLSICNFSSCIGAPTAEPSTPDALCTGAALGLSALS